MNHPYPTVEQMRQLATDVGCADSPPGQETFDLLLAGDGSGTTAVSPCGWAVYMFDTTKEKVFAHHGGASGGTNNLAELLPYVHAMHHYENSRPARAETRPIRVVIVSDSEVTVRCGNRVYARNANQAFWAAMDWFETRGYQLRWVHTRRNTTIAGTAADAIAGTIRKAFVSLETPCVK